MDVKIIMDRSPTTHNKKLLEFLFKNIPEYRKKLRMNVTTIPKKDHKTLDRKISALPAAYIGTNVVIGYKDIMREITTAYNKSLTMFASNPVQSYFESSIMKGIDEKEEKTDNDIDNADISKRFTDATNRRKSAYASRAPPKPGKSRISKNTADRDKPIDIKPARPSTKREGPATSTSDLMIDNMNESHGDYMSQNDPSSASNLETDPLMAAFWRNHNEVTPGVY
jgi:hypothetical protein